MLSLRQALKGLDTSSYRNLFLEPPALRRLLSTPDGRQAQGSAMNAGEVLVPTSSLISKNSEYELTFQQDGNIALHRHCANGQTILVWDLNEDRDDPLAIIEQFFGFGPFSGDRHSPGTLAMQRDGNLVAYDTLGNAYWASGTNGKTVLGLQLGNDGTVRLLGQDHQSVTWDLGTPRLRRKIRFDDGGEGWDGWATMVVRPSGDWSVDLRIDSFREPFDFTAGISLRGATQAVVAQLADHVNLAGNKHYRTSGHGIGVAAMYTTLEMENATLHVEFDTQSSVWKVLTPVLKFIVGGLLIGSQGGLLFGAVLVVGAGAVAELAGGDFSAGLQAAEGVLWMAGPDGMILAMAADVAQQAILNRRALRNEEYLWALDIFGELPPQHSVYVSDALGFGKRAFTFPHVDGSITVNLGTDADQPLVTNPVLLAHELTHVWQIQHASSRAAWVNHAVATQISNSLGGSSYDVALPDPGSWTALNLEQQANVVQIWRGDINPRHLSPDDPSVTVGATAKALQHYIDEDVHPGIVGL